jgi:hypothetical protein
MYINLLRQSFLFIFCFNIQKISILPTGCIDLFHMIIRLNNYYFPEQHELFLVCNGDLFWFLWIINVISKQHYMLWRVSRNILRDWGTKICKLQRNCIASLQHFPKMFGYREWYFAFFNICTCVVPLLV